MLVFIRALVALNMFDIASADEVGKGHVTTCAGESARRQRRLNETCLLLALVVELSQSGVYIVKMSDLKWNVDLVIRFLNIFKTYPCLWDPSHENYNKRDARDVAMKGLVLHLESEGFGTVHKDQLKIKIKSLKDSYRVELNKVKKSVKSGAGVEDIYKPKLGWFSVADSFWRTVMMGRDSSSNLVSINI